MKDKYDVYMQVALQPIFEPDIELNQKIIEESKSSKEKRKSKVSYRIAKIPAAVIVLAIVVPIVAFASEIIMERVFVTEHAISTGNQEYVRDEWIIAEEEEEVEVEPIQYEEGDSSVNWTSKRVECVNATYTNTYFYYDEYEKAIIDSGHDNWFNTTYVTQNASYVITEAGDDYMDKSVDADFLYHDGTFHVYQSIMTGNVASDCAHSIALQNTGNRRTYVSTSGREFTLVDEIRSNGEVEVVRTYVMIAYGQYYGYISFENLSEAEIQSVLDTICINEDNER